jgi:hypothetical protein
MKALKFFAILCIMFGFATSAGNAQHQPTVQGWNTGHDCHWIPCIEENACGEVIYHWFFGGNMNILRWDFIGTLIGERTGTVYQFRWTNNTKEIYTAGEVKSYHMTITIHADGIPIGQIHHTDHFTINANGEMVVLQDNDWIVVCK